MLYWPAGHAVHDVFPVPVLYVPALHFVHPVFPSPVLYWPAGHAVHFAAFAPLYVPALHFVQLLAPAFEYVPAVQSLHVNEFLLYVPAAHCLYIAYKVVVFVTIWLVNFVVAELSVFHPTKLYPSFVAVGDKSA